MSTKVLVTGTSVQAKFLQSLAEAGLTVDNPTHLLSEDELRAALSDSAAYLLGGDEYASRVALSAGKDLKVIAFLGVGYESFIDVPAATELGIRITNTPGVLSNSVAEFTVGLVLSCTRRLFLYASEFKDGHSGSEEKQRDLSALNVGIVGLGAIGTRIAEILRGGFGCAVSYYSRTRKPHEEARLGVTYLPLDQLVGVVDVLVVMTPGNPETKGLIGSSQIAGARNDMMIVNTARAEVVDPAALLEGLESGKIAYAAFDGFYDPTSEITQRLKALIPSKLMVTPHIGSLTHEARDGMARKATQSIINVLKTGTDPYITNSL